MVDLCNQNSLVITNTIFPHKKIHQWTWSHPGQKEGGHVLDYVLINQEYRSLITDTRAYRKTKYISDHNIIISFVQLSKKTYKKQYINNNIRLNFIKNPKDLSIQTINNFKHKLNENILETNQEGSVEQIWCQFKSTFINAINNCLPKKKNIREKEWITKEVKEVIEKKSNLYLKILNLKQRGESIPLSLKNNYNLVKKEAKNACRKASNFVLLSASRIPWTYFISDCLVILRDFRIDPPRPFLMFCSACKAASLAFSSHQSLSAFLHAFLASFLTKL